MSNPTLMGSGVAFCLGLFFVCWGFFFPTPIYITRIYAATCLLPLVHLWEESGYLLCSSFFPTPCSLGSWRLKLAFPVSLFFYRLNTVPSASFHFRISCAPAADDFGGLSLDLVWYINVCPALGSQNWTQYSICSLSNAEQRGRIASLELIAMLLVGIKLVFIITRM